MMGNRIVTILLVLLLCLGLPVAVSAEEEYRAYDFSHRREEYATFIASLHSKTVATDKGMSSGCDERIVLLRTDGREPAFCTAGPTVVVKGPAHCYTLVFDSQEDACLFVEEAAGADGVLYAELDRQIKGVAKVEVDGSDTEPQPAVYRSWGAEVAGFAAYTTFAGPLVSESVCVAVIDSGVYAHPALAKRIYAQGFDYVDQDFDSSNDGTGHGTHVAGIVADCTQNLPVWLYPIRVLDQDGNGYLSNIVNAIGEAVAQGSTVINLSLESLSHSDALHYAIQDALDAGVTVVIAAGNHSMDVSEVCPGHMTENGVIVVGAVDPGGAVALFSNYGEGVDLYAYGTDIESCSRSGGFIAQSGTSMAAPHVSAACAIIRLLHPSVTPGEAEVRLLAASVDEPRIMALRGMIPQDTGFRLEQLRMLEGQAVAVPMTAYPASSMEPICWQSTDEMVACITNGQLVAGRAGSCYLTAGCLGFDEARIAVEVMQEEGSVLEINIPIVEDEAFRDDLSIRQICFGPVAETIGSGSFAGCEALAWVWFAGNGPGMPADAFSPGTAAVFVAERGSSAAVAAEENGYQYILLP